MLVHGFASNKEVNWVTPGWLDTLKRAGRRVIALDNRGHGESTKLYDPVDYHTSLMAGDISALIEHLHLGRADVMIAAGADVYVRRWQQYAKGLKRIG